MLSKLSVKKPYTVLVAVVLILVLGFLSFRNMSTDLLPDMEFPYAIVMTTYPGASPEEVETAVGYGVCTVGRYDWQPHNNENQSGYDADYGGGD